MATESFYRIRKGLVHLYIPSTYETHKHSIRHPAISNQKYYQNYRRPSSHFLISRSRISALFNFARRKSRRRSYRIDTSALRRRMSASSASTACRTGSVVALGRFDGGGSRETCIGGGVWRPREGLIVLLVVCLCCRMNDGRFLSKDGLVFNAEIGSAGTGGVGGNTEANKFGEEREKEGGTDMKPLRRSEVDDLKDPAIELTTEGLRVRLTGCETSGTACICPCACFRLDVSRSGIRVFDEPAVENVIDSE
jgi:hypothetical protein